MPKFKKTLLELDKIKAKEIIKTISNFYNVDILSKSRKKNIISARHLAIYYVYKKTTMSQMNCALLFNKDHSTIRHSIISIENLLSYDREFRKEKLKVDEEVEKIDFQKIDDYNLFKEQKEVQILIEKLSLKDLIKLKKELWEKINN
jgi:hypothetical protein